MQRDQNQFGVAVPSGAPTPYNTYALSVPGAGEQAVLNKQGGISRQTRNVLHAGNITNLVKVYELAKESAEMMDT